MSIFDRLFSKSNGSDSDGAESKTYEDREDYYSELPRSFSFLTSSYKRYFEGYVEYEEFKPNGHKTIKRVYQEDYYIPDLTRGRFILRKVLYCLLWLAAVFFFFLASIPPVTGAMRILSTIGQLAIIAGIGWTMFGIFNYVFSPAKRTIHDWKTSSPRMIKGSFVSVCAGAFTCLIFIILLLTGDYTTKSMLLSISGYILFSACMLVIMFLEKKTRYLRSK